MQYSFPLLSPDLVVMITLTNTLTLTFNAVSAFCWGNFADLCIFKYVSCMSFENSSEICSSKLVRHSALVSDSDLLSIVSEAVFGSYAGICLLE